MDKYNVIEPASNLDNLYNDYMNWCRLPYDFKLRSDDECRRQHGCTNTEYYLYQKEKFLAKMDSEDEYKSNTVNVEESYTLDPTEILNSIIEDPDRYTEAKKRSEIAQRHPFVVIIDPDISDTETLNKIYNSFLMMNEKQRMISNEYSRMIWGYNVYDMYKFILHKLSPDSLLESVDNTNLEHIEKMVNEDINMLETAILNNDFITESCISKSYNKSGLAEIIFKNIKNSRIYFEHFNLRCMPLVMPQYTTIELESLGINTKEIEPEKYGKALKNAKSAEELLSLGWPAEIEYNDESRKDAVLHQYIHLQCMGSNHIYINKNINQIDNQIPDKSDLIGLYKVYLIEEFYSNDPINKSIKNVYLAFRLTNEKLTMFNLTTFEFSSHYLSELKDTIDISVFYLHKNCYSALKKACTKGGKYYSLPDSILLRYYSNKEPLDYNSVVIYTYINKIYCMIKRNLECEYKDLKVGTQSYIYKLYNCSIDKNSDSFIMDCINLSNMFLSKDKISEFLSTIVSNYGTLFVDDLLAAPIIYTLD